jgi:Ca2+-binding RTX toxin-like protein
VLTNGYERRSGETHVNSITASYQYRPRITYLSDGRFVMVWRDDSASETPDATDVRGQIFNADGSKSGGELLVNTTTVGHQWSAAVIATPSGGFTVVWTDTAVGSDDTGTVAQRFDSGGEKLGGEIAVTTPAPGGQTAFSAATLADGRFVVAWTDVVGDTSETDQNMVGARAQLFDVTGAKIGGEILLNASTPGVQQLPNLAALGDGGWVAIWTDTGAANGIVGQRFAADGSKVGGEFLVNTVASGDQFQAAVAGLAGGGFVVTWSDRSGVGGDALDSALKGRIYGADGTPAGGEFLVNSSIAASQFNSRIAPLASGGFVVSWSDNGGLDGSGYSVRAQVFDATGARVGTEFAVNRVGIDTQDLGDVAAFGDAFVIAWTDYSGADGDLSGVKFTRFVPSPATAGSDTVTGSVGDDEMFGLDGNDSLTGGEGDDVLAGGDGDDVLAGEAGNDDLDGGDGADDLDGGSGDDRLRLTGASGSTDLAAGGSGVDRLEASFVAAAAGLSLSIAGNGADGYDGWIGTGPSARLVEFTGIERFDLALSDFADAVTGGDLADTLRGRGGDDSLSGGGGDDILDGGAGIDLLAGGAGSDRYLINDRGDAIMEEASAAGVDEVVTSLERYTLTANVEKLTGTALGQTLIANAAGSIVSGEDGDDAILGDLGDDTLNGGAGNDRVEDLVGGQDVLDGGAGNDIVSIVHHGATIGSSATLKGGAGDDLILFDGDKFAVIDAGDGNDIVRLIDAHDAAVTLGLGQDTIAFDSMTIPFGSSYYVADFKTGSQESGGDRLDLHTYLGRTLSSWDQVANPFTMWTGIALNSTYGNAIITTGHWNEYRTLIYLNGVNWTQMTEFNLGGFTTSSTPPPATTRTGTAAAEKLYGGAGADTISGLDGNDRIEGGFGGDTLDGGEGDDYLNGQTGDDVLVGGAGSDILEDHAGGGDSLSGGAGDDFLSVSRNKVMVARAVTVDGGDGDDLLWYDWIAASYESPLDAMGGAVTLKGGLGADTIVIWDALNLLNVDFGADTSNDLLRLDGGLRAAALKVVNFSAGDGGDRIDLADHLATRLIGWDQQTNPFAAGFLALGSDGGVTILRLDVNGGGDSFSTFISLPGVDASALTAFNLGGFAPDGSVPAGATVTGTADDDTIAGGIGGDHLLGLDGDDVITGGIGADTIDGGDGNDRLYGNGGDDIVQGGAGDDRLEDADGGADTLDGGLGNDRFIITRGATTLALAVSASGGEGKDSFDVTSANTSAIAIDAGAGDDLITFFALKGSASVTLGDGQDSIRLDPSYFGPHTNQTRVKEIVVSDFAAGPGGDFIDIKQALDYGAMWWPDDGEGFRQGTLRLIQDGADTLLQYTYASDNQYQTLFRFTGRGVGDFTADNFAMELPKTLVVADDGATVVNQASFFGRPAVIIEGDGVHFTNALGSVLVNSGQMGTDTAAIRITGAGVTIVNELGAQIRGTVAIAGSEHADTVLNYGLITTTLQLGDGTDYFFEKVGGINNGGGEYTYLEMGAGDDLVEFDMTGATYLDYVNALGGDGNDTLIIRGISGVATGRLGTTSGIETMRLIGDPGASINLGARPTVNDVWLTPGLTLIVPNPSSPSIRPYTLPAFGTLHLEGGHFNTNLQASFAHIVGTDAAENVQLINSLSPAAGTTANGLVSVSLGGGDDMFLWGIGHTRPGSVDGGAGSDTLRITQTPTTAGVDLSVFTGFERIDHLIYNNGQTTVHTVTGVGAGTTLLLTTTHTLVSSLSLNGIDRPDLVVGAGGTKLIIAADSRVSSISDRSLVDSATLAATAQNIDNRGVVVGGADLGGGNDVLGNSGTFGAAVLLGAGNDTFTGLAGGSVTGGIHGGAGNDVYILETGAYQVVELTGEGIDEVRTALGNRNDPAQMYVLPEHVENLIGTSAIGQGVYANSLDNLVRMGAGADLVVLHDGGNDTIESGGGDDFIYYGAAFTDADSNDGGAGYDTVGLLGAYTLTFGEGDLTGIEKLALYSSGPSAASGVNAYHIVFADGAVAKGAALFVAAGSLRADETLTLDGSAELDGKFQVMGGAGNDSLTGGAKADLFYGGLGNDMLSGSGGNDTLVGGSGADILNGGTGNDWFRFEAVSDSSLAGGIDTILDFKSAGGADRIDLSAIDADGVAAGNQAFTFIGVGTAFGSIAGQLRVVEESGDWFVQGDTNGDGVADLVIRVGADIPLWAAGDFVL